MTLPTRTKPVRVDVATLATGVPVSTIHRWCRALWMHSTVKLGIRYVIIEDVEALRDTLKARTSLRNLTR